MTPFGALWINPVGQFSFNKVYLLGNLTRDPEPRDLPSGTKLASFGLEVNRSYRKADGEEVEETTFVDI